MNFIPFGPLRGKQFVQNYNLQNSQPTLVDGHQTQDGNIIINRIRTEDSSVYLQGNNQNQPLSSNEVLDFMNKQAEQLNLQPQNGIGGQQGGQIDERETAVAQRLNVPVEEFHNLPEQQKQQIVAEYNQEHPNDPIPDKIR